MRNEKKQGDLVYVRWLGWKMAAEAGEVVDVAVA